VDEGEADPSERAGRNEDRGAPADPLSHVRGIAERVARSYGLEIFDVQLRRESIGPVLRVIIDRPAVASSDSPREEAPIGIEDCRHVSQDIGAILDVEDPMDRAYTLEVSSPGLDRPLRHEGDYRRFVGRLARLVLRETVDGQKHFKGRLRSVEGGAVTVEDDGGSLHRLPMAAISRGRLEVEF
jgi:ribosome maturation factor RimP